MAFGQHKTRLVIGIQWTKASQLALPKASHDKTARLTATNAATATVCSTPIGDQHQRKQQAELGFVGEEPERAASAQSLFHEPKRAADECGGEETVLAGGYVPDRGGKSERNQDAGAPARMPASAAA